MGDILRFFLLSVLFIIINGCQKISSGSDVPATSHLDSMSVEPESDSTPVIVQDVTTQDTVNFNTLEIPTKGESGISDLHYAKTKIDSIISIGFNQLGTPYKYGSCEPGGFDCSGFIYFVFKSVGIELPRSSAAMETVGQTIPMSEARKGDLIFFTGTDPTDRTVGHAGIIITNKGEPLEFIHSSSNMEEGGVKITNYAKSNYDKRFMNIKRIL